MYNNTNNNNLVNYESNESPFTFLLEDTYKHTFEPNPHQMIFEEHCGVRMQDVCPQKTYFTYSHPLVYSGELIDNLISSNDNSVSSIVEDSAEVCDSIPPSPRTEEFNNEDDEEFVHLCKNTIKLPTTKTPVIDTVVMLAMLNLSSATVPESMAQIKVTNAENFLRYIRMFCPKQKQTTSDDARIKALTRWFVGIPPKRVRKERVVFKMTVKPSHMKKWRVAVKRVRDMLRDISHPALRVNTYQE